MMQQAGETPTRTGPGPGRMDASILTIGHSNLALEDFEANLERNEVRTLVDVRSMPQSRYVPHFNRDRLERTLRRKDIRYAFMGDTMGGRPAQHWLYDEQGRVRYDRVAGENGFRQALGELQRLALESTAIIIMCAEGDPLSCHRTLLVAHELNRAGAAVEHVMTDGSVISHDRLMDRLLRKLGLEPAGMEPAGMSREKLIEEAVLQQALRAGYQRRPR